MSEIEPRICQDCGKDFGMDGIVIKRLSGTTESRCLECRDAHDAKIDSETPCPICRRVGGTYVPWRKQHSP